MKLPYREYHLLELLNSYDLQKLPLDQHMRDYFRAHSSLGSKDRGFIAETAYALIRWLGLLDHLCHKPYTWEQRWAVYQTIDWQKIKQDGSLPPHIKVSFPVFLFQLLVKHYGQEKAIELCLINNTPAPTTVRANPLKITREELFKRWENLYPISFTSKAPYGITFDKRINFFEMPEFKEGLFEVQDEGSQLIAELITPQPGNQVLDYCAGSGGKALAFASHLKGKGQIYLHDIRPFALQEARKRLRRAGIQNSQILLPDSDHAAKLKKRMDWVLVDVPCSGTGTLRRNPDMKWKFNIEMLERLIGQQRVIFEKALSFMQPKGRIVYATCSVLPEENEQQIAHFIRTYQLKIEGEVFQSIPSLHGMDGFFGVVLKKDTIYDS